MFACTVIAASSINVMGLMNVSLVTPYMQLEQQLLLSLHALV